VASVTAVCGQKPPQTYDNNRRNTCPEPRVKWAFPETPLASPLFTWVSGLPIKIKLKFPLKGKTGAAS